MRLKVEDAKGFSIGSGTIIDTHENEAVLISCGHIFRESQGQGKISVDLFHPQHQTVEGKLLDYNLKRDIAIVSLSPRTRRDRRLGGCHKRDHLRSSDAAFSIGCDKGGDPTVCETKITSLNRYQGPPNIAGGGTTGRWTQRRRAVLARGRT